MSETVVHASVVGFTPKGHVSSSNLQTALEEIIDQHFVQATAPASVSTDLEEGDMWYNTTDDKLMVYRNTIWEEVTLSSQLAEGTEDQYTDVILNGGYF
jgi:hypothetical protein